MPVVRIGFKCDASQAIEKGLVGPTYCVILV